MKGVLGAIAVVLVAGHGVPAAVADEPPAPAPPEAIVAYHDSGEWAADTSSVVRRATRALRRRLDDAERPAIVLDVDETALSSYACLKPVAFDRARVDCAQGGHLPAIPQTRRLYRYARAHGVTVFLVTGRRERLRDVTVANLRRAGYRGRLRLRMRPDRERPGTHDGWKARTRRAITRRGQRILVNLGDQRSDLDGGYARRSFKLPNPMYVIPTA
jgi:predicted secreted acid phosphatase